MGTFHVYPGKIDTFEDLREKISALLGYSKETIYFKDKNGRFFYDKTLLVDQLFPLGLRFNSFIPKVYVEIRRKANTGPKNVSKNLVEQDFFKPFIPKKSRGREMMEAFCMKLRELSRFFIRLSALAFLVLWAIYWTVSRAAFDRYTTLQTPKTYADEILNGFQDGNFRPVIENWILRMKTRNSSIVLLPWFRLSQKRKKTKECDVPLFTKQANVLCLSDEWDYSPIPIPADYGRNVSTTSFRITEDVDTKGQYVDMNHYDNEQSLKVLDALWLNEWVNASTRYLVLNLNFFLSLIHI
eukprot:TRINITY_DN25230_c0_g1_i1.p1 TRINITY_DN25230_c0_g1~~TRINITY_DN25230_c0_g1_i1.p1  ORF type:complete len:298 (-),score=24.25 TRINITY_DN25230_c0_g1_i1:60-953(-)